MPGETNIAWTDDSWNIFYGCTRCAPECTNCYAERLAGTRLAHKAHYMGLSVLRGDGQYHWTGEVRFDESLLTWPIKRAASRLIFTNAMSDPFHPNVLPGDRDKFFAAMLLGTQHVYQLLTKRPAEMAAYISDPDTKWAVFIAAQELWTRELAGKPTKKHPNGLPFPAEKLVWPLPHVWLGCSAGSQKSADLFIPSLLSIPSPWLVWLSAEPLIAPLALRPEWLSYSFSSKTDTAAFSNHLQWVVAGGESGYMKDTRPMHPAWGADIIADCENAGVPVFWKQTGVWRLLVGEDRETYTNHTAVLLSGIESGRLRAVSQETGENTRGGLIVSRIMSEGNDLFRFSGEKEAEGDAEQIRQFPPFPATFRRA